MLYRVILTKNGEYKKTLHRCKKRTTAFINFNRIKDENNVLFERKFINYNGIKPVEYGILVVKDTEDTDKFRMVRDKFGKIVEEKPFGDWTVLNDADYSFEETFWMFGYSPLHERKNIVEVMGVLMNGLNNPRKTKQIVIINNKLVFYDEDNFDMVICKCKDDARRLHHALAKACSDNGIKALYFMGSITNKKMLGEYYDLIHEHTNWSYTKIWRTTTRP